TSKNPLSHHYWEKPGFYTVTLWVSDGLFNVSTSIQVQITNNLPELEIILDNEPMYASPIYFNATGIGDPDGDNVTFRWDFGDGSMSVLGALVNHTYPASGDFIVTLHCNDTFDTVSKQKTISIPRNKGPVIRVNAKELAFIDRTHWLDASLSEDPEGHELSFKWDFPDGTSAEGPEVNYTFEDYGEQTVTLTVEDEYGESSQKTLSFTVKDYESYYPTLQDINEPFSRTDVVQEPYIYYSWVYDHYTGEVTPVAHKGGGYRIYILDLPPGYWTLTLNVIEGGNVDLLSFDRENYFKYLDDFSTVVDTMDSKTSMRSSGISFGFYGSDTIYFIVDNNEVMAFGATPLGNVTYTISVSQGTPPDNTPWDDDDDVEEDNAPYWIIYVFFIGLPLLVIVGITVGGIIYSVTRSKRKDMGREQMERELRESVILGRGTIGRSPEPPTEEEPQADGDESTPEQEEQVDPGMSLINEILFDTSNGPNQQMPNGTTEKGEEDPFGAATGEGEQDGGRLADILFSADDIDEDPDLAPLPPEN
ncbi:MAG: PKD domain-containing protein, partial [Thermoplasmatota archaeon]